MRTVMVKKNGVVLFTVGAKDEAHRKNSAICFSRRAEDMGQEQNVVIFLTIASESYRPSAKYRPISYCGGRKAWPKNKMSSYFLLWRAKGLAKK
jgi:hypothetical protein